jgi:hypothetical protein
MVLVEKYLSFYERYSIPESDPVTRSLSDISLLKQGSIHVQSKVIFRTVPNQFLTVSEAARIAIENCETVTFNGTMPRKTFTRHVR